MSADVKILIEGYTNADTVGESGEEKTCPTVVLIRDKDLTMVVDPGTVGSRQDLMDALEREGLKPEDVEFVCITHSHIDHYINIGMFPNAKVLEYFGIWKGDKVEEWKEQFNEHIQILKTPGHDYTCITLFVTTDNGVVAVCGDVFWKENYPEEDKYASDQQELNKSRDLVIKMSDWIIPGHGKMYKSGGASSITKQKAALAEKKGEVRIGVCKKCRRVLFKVRDRCECQPKLCYKCCECDTDCGLCNCKHKI